MTGGGRTKRKDFSDTKGQQQRTQSQSLRLLGAWVDYCTMKLSSAGALRPYQNN